VHILDGLNDAQRTAVTTDANPLCILAGAGSGKTRVLTRRIAHRIVDGTADAAHVLALTFTRKAAEEMGKRLRALGVRDQVVAGTFHAVAYAQLRHRWADRGEHAPALLDRKARLIVPLLGRPGREGAVHAADVAAEIEWAKARMVVPGQYEVEAAAAGRVPPVPAHQMAAWYQSYEADKAKRGLVDFDDLLNLCARALATDADFAASQRWRFRHLFVDEFQDVNPVQYQLLRGWAADRPDVCVVGDPNQAIYSWNGADPRILQHFPKLFPGAEVVELTDNYRSTPQVLTIANAVLESATPARAVQPDGEVAAGRGILRPNRPDGAVPSVHGYESDVAEAKGIAARLRRAHRPGTSWSDLAVLVRTNAQAVLFEEALRTARIPYRIRGDGAFLHQPEVKTALKALRTTGAGDGTVPFASRIADLEEMAASVAVEERRDRLEALVRLAREYARLDGNATVGGFLAWLAATVRGDDTPQADGEGVDVVTFHRAKGLEWPVVFVAGLERGLVPIARADTPDAEAEERRLLYVALTRARDEVHCSWAQRRTFGTKDMSRQPSPWLEIVEAACGAAAGGTADWRRFLEKERRALRSRSGGRADAGGARHPEPALLQALKEWRARAARAASVPAYVIFHDTTLAAVAERKPNDRAELLALPGLGPVKAERYGDALLEVVRGIAAGT
jgi:DNA helicase-2/ATP-dependent DNA helicase PcrA